MPALSCLLSAACSEGPPFDPVCPPDKMAIAGKMPAIAYMTMLDRYSLVCLTLPYLTLPYCYLTLHDITLHDNAGSLLAVVRRREKA